jgi:hypothetical protein
VLLATLALVRSRHPRIVAPPLVDRATRADLRLILNTRFDQAEQALRACAARAGGGLRVLLASTRCGGASC